MLLLEPIARVAAGANYPLLHCVKPNSGYGVLCAAAAILSVAMLQAQTPDLNRPIAPIEVQRLNGPPLQISNFAEHGATVILFLSTRSDKTASAAAAIQRLNRMSRRQRVIFAGVFPNPAESADEVRAFCQDSGFIFPCYRDPRHKAVAQLGATITPEAFVIDKEARLRYRGGVGTQDGAGGLAGALKSLAAGPPPPQSSSPRMELPFRIPATRRCLRILSNRFTSPPN